MTRRFSLLPASTLLLFAVSLVAPLAFSDDDKAHKKRRPGYLGVYMEAASRAGKGAVRLSLVVPNSPAEKGGLRSGDLVLGIGGGLFEESREKVLECFKAFLKGKSAGDMIRLTVERVETSASWSLDGRRKEVFRGSRLPDLDRLLEGKSESSLRLSAQRGKRVLTVTVILGEKASRKLQVLPENKGLCPKLEAQTSVEEELIARCLSVPQIEEAYRGVLARFEEDETNDDAFRLKVIRYLHRDPKKLTVYGRGMGRLWREAAEASEYRKLLAAPLEVFESNLETKKKALQTIPGRLPKPKKGSSAHSHIRYIVRLMERAAHLRAAALSRLSKDDRAFLAGLGFEGLRSRFLENIYLHTDSNKERWRRNLRVLSLLEKVDVSLMILAGFELSSLGDKRYLGQLKSDLCRFYKDTINQDLLYAVKHSIGDVRILGVGSQVLQGRANLVIDLGGHDVYAGSFAAARGDDNPVAVLLDLAGDDQYQSTTLGSFGSGILGVALLVDGEGDDVYLGSESGTQGMAFCGWGTLLDWSGDDDYRGRAFAQGSALACGFGALLDFGGNDVLSGTQFAQGFAGPWGYGLCFQRGGDDRYLGALGRGSSYGTKDVYQGFCQGAACGFRGYASGGLGFLVDVGGADRYGAGNFSQGGGYYFSLGALWDLGDGDDRYLGSRYGQGFSAHSALGFFFEAGGNDRYRGVVGALQGAAWDLSASVFIDQSGDDDFWGKDAFSLGASAHNGMAFFFDHEGCDVYRNAQGLGRAGPNDYHGGGSLSLFVDGGVGKDRYLGPGLESQKAGQRAQLRKEMSLVLNVDGESWSVEDLKMWLGGKKKKKDGK